MPTNYCRSAARLLVYLLPLALLSLPGWSVSQTSEFDCKPVELAKGGAPTIIKDAVAPEEILCYEFSAQPGQQVNIKVKSTYENTMFGILDMVDSQDDYSFTAQGKTYQFIVSQLERSGVSDDFELTLTIK